MLFAQSGNTGSLDLSILSALAAGSFAATHELARRLGESEFSALYHEGHGHHILMSALHFDVSARPPSSASGPISGSCAFGRGKQATPR